MLEGLMRPCVWGACHKTTEYYFFTLVKEQATEPDNDQIALGKFLPSV